MLPFPAGAVTAKPTTFSAIARLNIRVGLSEASTKLTMRSPLYTAPLRTIDCQILDTAIEATTRKFDLHVGSYLSRACGMPNDLTTCPFLPVAVNEENGMPDVEAAW